MKFGAKQLREKTPAKMRKIGNVLLTVQTTIAGFAYLQEFQKIAVASLIIGVIGRVLVEYFSEEDKQQANETE